MGGKMITPAYALTATERVLPRLALDFTTETLDPRVTVTRALNTATRINSSGLVESVNANLPRFDYDPSTLQSKGLLIEESRANLALYSGALSQSPTWTNAKGGTAATPTVTGNYAVAPDGTTTATRIQLSLGGGTTTSDFAWQVQTLTGTSCFGSFWIKTTDGSSKTIHLRAASSASVAVTGTWTRYTWNAGTLAGNIFGVGLRGGQTPTNSDTADILVWGAQLEAGAFATSYIPTTTTSLTRNADVVSMTGTNFSDWYNATEGTFVSSFRMPVATGSTRRAISVNDGTTNDTIQIALVNSSNQAYVEIRDNLAIQVSATVGSGFTVGTPVTAALAYKANDFAYAAFGEATGTDPTGTVPTVSQMEIGSQLGVYFNGWVSKINYYPLRLTNAEVRAVSK
jgi:hypothetical protein